jgi:hypothetical protein
MTYIENRKVLADSGEVVTNITLRDPITALWVELRAQNGATYNKASPLAACIDSIELIDGSRVLWSLDGYEALAVGSYGLGYIPYQLVVETEGLYQNVFFPLMFGRGLGDTSLSLDPTRFSNLQVRFKWNLANVNAVGATGFVTASGRLTVMADVMEGAEAPTGLITCKEQYAFTTAASGTEYIDLPSDAPIRSIYLRSYEAAVGGLCGISNIKVNSGQGKFTPFDMGTTDLTRWLTMFYPPMHYKHLLKSANGGTSYFLLKKDEQVAYTPETGDCVVSAPNNGIGEQTLSVYTAGSGDTNQRNIWALVHGWVPVSTLYIPMGDKWDAATWFDPSIWGSNRLELTNNNAGASAYVVIEQAVQY